VTRFDERWRRLARSAGRAPEPPFGPPPLHLVSRALGAAPASSAESWRLWWGPVAAAALLCGSALPFVEGALQAAASLDVSLRDLPRPPTLPTPPLPRAPILPKPPALPTAGGALDLFLAPKETRP